MKLADKLKEEREAAGLTQAALASKSGVPLGNVRNYEQGIRIAPFIAIVRMAKAMGTDCTAFADCEDVAGKETLKAKRKAKK